VVIDRNSPAFKARFDQKLAELRETIDETGCVIVPIIDGGFAYTVGLTKRGHPELLSFGPPDGVAHFLEEVAVKVLRNDFRVAPPSLTVDMAEGETHTLTVRAHSYLKGDPVLGMVVGIFGPGKPALVIDIYSCRCIPCTEDQLRLKRG
jgi:hypothetical protein